MSGKSADMPSFVPSEFMRSRRPALYSDSKVETTPALSREVFAYHLDTLTSRKEETKFEHFARRLAEKEICPNLLPQTGPTGGGDSKVDAETYPVAGEIARTWYVGVDLLASEERWAFAFSAKKQWRSKMKSDVGGIISTRRDYKRIFFITNQFVSDKKRASIEDELTREYNVPIRLFDRTWIVEKVFGNDRMDVAIEALGLTQFESSKKYTRGPNDTRREAELGELDSQIADTERYRGVPYQLVEACLHSAILARGLNRPRQDVEGRFGRAERIATDVGHRQQQLRVVYARAWTTFWWYDDFGDFSRLYSKAEAFAIGSQQAEDLELLFNLWQLLRSSVTQKKLDLLNAALEARTDTLKTSLDRLASDESRPNNALCARTDRLLLDLAETIGDKGRTEVALHGLGEVVERGQALVHYPVERLSDLLAEIGGAFADSVAFDRLFEEITVIVERRNGEGRAGGALLERGMQKLRADLPYEAIRLFGRAQHKLAKREYRGELVGALVGAGLAYEDVGLLWAARSSVLLAAHFALSEYRESGAIIRPAFRAVQKLIWLELKLGRVPSALAWSELADVLKQHLEASEGVQSDFAEERQLRDMVLAILFLRADLDTLRQVDCLVGVLEQLELPHSQCALLYVLGYESRLRDDGWIPETETVADLKSGFRRLLEQPAADDVAKHPHLLSEVQVDFRTKVLGCQVEVAATNSVSSILLSEAILGSLEAFLATSLNLGILPYRESFRIVVESSSDLLQCPVFQFDEGNRGTVTIRHSTPIHAETPEAQRGFADWMFELVMQVIVRVSIIKDLDTFMSQVAGEEKGIERAINAAHIESIVSHIMGPDPKIRLVDWQSTYTGEKFPLVRVEPWSERIDKDDDQEQSEARDLKYSKDEPPPHLFNRESGKHSDIQVSSLIDGPLWDKGKWRAVYFGITVDGQPPILGLAFENNDAASAIFSEWRRRLGKVDSKDELRVSVLTGIDKTNTAAYRVVVGTKLQMPQGSTQFIVTTARINSMNPSSSTNLDSFLRSLAMAHRYWLVPVHYSETSQEMQPIWDLAIGKHELGVRPIWQVGPNDEDIVAIDADDDPILPTGGEEAPVLAALQRKRSRSSE